jgi:hypothetical protein
MSFAWQTTEEDISAVLANTKLDEISNSEFYMDKLDHNKIAEAALFGDDLETQTDFAYQEIEKQIREIIETFDKG